VVVHFDANETIYALDGHRDLVSRAMWTGVDDNVAHHLAGEQNHCVGLSHMAQTGEGRADEVPGPAGACRVRPQSKDFVHFSTPPDLVI